MDIRSDARRPWNPDPSWADPLLALLATVALLLSGLTILRRQNPPPATAAGIQARLLELPFAAARAFPGGRAALLQRIRGEQGLVEPWDRAVLGVLLAESGDLEGGRGLTPGPALPGPAAEPFRRCWARAFEGAAPVQSGDRDLVRAALGGGWTAALLEAHLDRLDGRNPGPGLEAAQGKALRRLGALAAGGALLALACLGGVAFGIYLLVARPKAPAPPPEDASALPWRALLLLFLAWYLGMLTAGTLMAGVTAALPSLRPFAVPLAYLLHASWGVFLIGRSRGLGFRELWAGLTPPPVGRALLWGFGFLALAVPSVLLTALLLAPLLRHLSSPQRELLQAIAALRSPMAVLLTGATVAFLGPAFEELLFRGTLLPWAARRWGWSLGLLVTSFLFALMHLQPAGLPTLTVLGMILGLAFRQGGSLWTVILVHGLWNGGVFLFLRLMVV